MASSHPLEGKVAVITGSNSGIGEAIAIEFVRKGALVTLHGRNVEHLATVAGKCTDLAGSKDKILKVVGELTQEDVRINLIQETLKKFGKIDILINNAGYITSENMSEDFDLSRLDAMLDIHVRVPFHLMKLAIPHLTKTKGNIINISSIAGLRTLSTNSLEYGTAKAAMDHLTRFAALELGPKGIRANVISPGAIKTPFFEKIGLPLEELPKVFKYMAERYALGRTGEPEEIARVAAFLASDEASFVTGITIPVEGGNLLMPPGAAQ